MIVYTPRLVLREFEEGDWEAVLAYQSDPRYLRYSPWTARSAKDVRAFVAMFLAWREASPRTRYQLAITLPAEGSPAPGALIGNVGIRKSDPDAAVAELGYELNPAHWGHGYASEAAAAMLRFAFVDLALHRVSATCIAENAASARVLERVGRGWCWRGACASTSGSRGAGGTACCTASSTVSGARSRRKSDSEGWVEVSADRAPISADLLNPHAWRSATRSAPHRRWSTMVTWNRRRRDG